MRIHPMPTFDFQTNSTFRIGFVTHPDVFSLVLRNHVLDDHRLVFVWDPSSQVFRYNAIAPDRSFLGASRERTDSSSARTRKGNIKSHFRLMASSRCVWNIGQENMNTWCDGRHDTHTHHKWGLCTCSTDVGWCSLCPIIAMDYLNYGDH